MRRTLEGVCAHAATGARVRSLPVRPTIAAMKAMSAALPAMMKGLSEAGRESDEEQKVGRYADEHSPRWAATGGWRTRAATHRWGSSGSARRASSRWTRRRSAVPSRCSSGTISRPPFGAGRRRPKRTLTGMSSTLAIYETSCGAFRLFLRPWSRHRPISSAVRWSEPRTRPVLLTQQTGIWLIATSTRDNETSEARWICGSSADAPPARPACRCSRTRPPGR